MIESQAHLCLHYLTAQSNEHLAVVEDQMSEEACRWELYLYLHRAYRIGALDGFHGRQGLVIDIDQLFEK
jgi:demethoxyubiquinone hydroxylase (CLK1/Coq7/Cat5 family)